MAKKKEGGKVFTQSLTDDKKIEITKFVLNIISNDLLSLRKATLVAKDHFKLETLSKSSILNWIEDYKLNDHYTRVCASRQEDLFEEIIDLSDGVNNHLDDPVIVSRNKLQIDARKWALSKMNPKKYGDKVDVDHTTNGESINIISLGGGIKPNED